jgi:hypothetical protein
LIHAQRLGTQASTAPPAVEHACTAHTDTYTMTKSMAHGRHKHMLIMYTHIQQ